MCTPRRRGSIPAIYLMLTVLCLLLVGCNVNLSSQQGFSTRQSSASTCQENCTSGSGTQGVKVFVEPNAGDHVIVNAISAAKSSVQLEIYLLTDRSVIKALEEDAHRGINVSVMLEPHPYGGGPSPQRTLDELSAAGVKTKPTSSSFSLTHEKGMIIDNATVYIMTANFTLSALGGSRSTTNREYGIIDTNQQDVQAVVAIFQADWNRTTAHFNDSNLVVSPINSRSTFESLINGAHKSLLIEAEEMQDQDIEQAIVNAAKHGVQVQVIMPQPRSTSEGDGSGDSNSQGITVISQGGAHVKEDPHLYMHAKIMVVDGQKAFVGSENISTASLDKNRELGILISDQGVLNTLTQTFQQDWGESQGL